MATIPNSAVPDAYSISKQVYHKLIEPIEGVSQLTENHVINPASARDYIDNFRCMMEGRRFSRTLNEYSMRYFFKSIAEEYPDKLSSALVALMEHIEYYEGVQTRLGTPAVMRANRSIHQEYSQLLPDNLRVLLEQAEVESITKQTQSIGDIVRDLKNLRESDPEVIIIQGKSYKRDYKTIAQIKILRKFTCQICQKQIPKKNGGFYIEAAHIWPKSKKGRETPDNIMILCPNHHKEFDFGDVGPITRNNEQVSFSMNGALYTIDLAIK